MKRYNFAKKPKRKSRDEIIDEVNAASTTDFTGLIPSAPKYEYEEDSYEDIYPTGVPTNEVAQIED